VQVGFILALIWAVDGGVEGAMVAGIASNVLIMAAVLVLLRWKHGLGWVTPSLRGLYEMFHYGVRYYAGKLSNEVNFQVGTIIVAMFAVREEVGLFAVAATLTTRVMVIPDTLVTVLLPRAAGDGGRQPQLIAQSARVVGLVCGVVLAVIVVFATPIVSLLFSPAFLPAVPLVRILAAGVLLRCAAKVFVPYLLGVDRPGVASLAVALGTAVNLGLLWVLMPAIGLAGAAVAMAGSYVVSSILLTAAFHRLSGLGLWETWRLRRSDLAPLGRALRRATGRAAGEAA